MFDSDFRSSSVNVLQLGNDYFYFVKRLFCMMLVDMIVVNYCCYCFDIVEKAQEIA